MKVFKIYFLYYLKKLTSFFLHSSFCCKNKVYSLILKSHFLNRLKSFKSLDGPFRPRSVEIELTNLCNLECVFCPNSKHNRERGIMSFDTFKKIVDEISSLAVGCVVISGFGESLIDKDLIEKLTYLRNSVSVKVELVTNGILLTDKVCEIICKEKLVDSLGISIDAADSDTYKRIHKFDEFDIVINNLKSLVKAKKYFNSSLPLVTTRFKDFSLNKGSFGRFVNVFSGISDRISSYVNICKWPNSEMEVESVDRRRLIKISCPNLWENIRINWNGDAILCCMDYEGRVVLGNIKDKSIVNIWNGDRINDYRKRHRKFQFDNLEICKDCDINSHLVIPW